MLLIIAGTALMIVLDATILSVALPSMGRYFHRDQADMTWTVNAYTLAFGGLLLLGARAGDIFGRRRMLLIGLGLFTLGSLAAGLAASFEWMLAARALEGVGAAIASPIALSLTATEFNEGTARNRAIGIYSAVGGGGAAIGLLLGGVLTTYLNWRWVLFVNVPIGLALLAVTYLFITESARTYAQIDIAGALISVAGAGGLVYGFIHAADDGWRNTETILLLCLSGAVLVAFVLFEAFIAAEPILPVRLFLDRNRSSAYFIIMVVGASLFGMFYLTTFFFQGVLGYSALKAGAAFAPVAALVIFSTQVSSTLLPRYGPKPLLVIGCVLLTAASAWLSTMGPDSGYLDTALPGMALVALGVGTVLVPLTAVVLARVDDLDAGLASAVLNYGQQIGGSLGLAVLTSVSATAATGAGTTEGHKLLAQYGLSEHLLNFLQLGQALQGGAPASHAARQDLVARHAVNVVQAHAYGAGFQAATAFGIAALVVSLVAITTRRKAATESASGARVTLRQ